MFYPPFTLDNTRDRTGYQIERETGRRRKTVVRGLYCCSYPSQLKPTFFCFAELILIVRACPRCPKANDFAVTDSAADTRAQYGLEVHNLS